MKARLLLGASALAFGLTASHALAADSRAPTVDEVIVTATKRAETLHDVPISLSAVTGQAMEAQAVRQFTDLQSSVPNLQIDQTNGNYAITIRGLGSGAGNLSFEQSVGLFVDGVYSSRSRSLQTAFLDVERVEVVRGPQGALFGKNTNAGAISVVTRAPSRNFEAEVRADAEVAEGGAAASGYITGPLTDTLSGRLSAIAGHSGAYIENRLTHKWENGNDYRGVRGQLRWEPSTDFQATLKLDGAENNIDGGNIVYNKLGTSPLANAARLAAGGSGLAQEWPAFWRTSHTPSPEYNNTKTGTSELTFNWSVGGWKLTSITAYQAVKSDASVDIDAGALDLVYYTLPERDNQFSQELRGARSFGPVDLTAGVTYLDSKLKVAQFTTYNAAQYRGPPHNTGQANRRFSQKSESISPYLAADYHFLENWVLSGSLRYSRETKDADIIGAPVGDLSPTYLPYNIHGRLHEGLWDYSAKTQYKINPSAQIYLSYATGTKGGGFVSNDSALLYNVQFNHTSIAFASEKAKSWELGSKLRLFEGRGDLDVALFDTEFTNLQVSSYNGVAFITGNAAKATSKGVEVETNWRPNEIFSFGASVAYLNARYDNFPGGACLYNAPATCKPATNNLKGSPLLRAPDWKATVYLEAEEPVGDGLMLSGRVSADYTDLAYYQPDLNPLNAQPAYTKVNARVALKSSDGGWELALIGNNLTNVVTFSQAFNVPLIGGDTHGAMINPPRTITLEAVKHF